MRTRNNPERKSEIEFLRAARQINNKVIYVAITIIIVVAVVAMTGVYYEYW